MNTHTPPSGVISLLTDFGTSDPFVGVMKGVMLRRDPSLRFVDLSHSIPPQAVASAAFWLDKVFSYLPQGSVHLVVVDPEVGSARAALAAYAAGHYFVAPDNGVLAKVLKRDPSCTLVALDVDTVRRLAGADGSDAACVVGGVSTTFHGRDVFAPAAALLAGRTPLSALGEVVARWVEGDESVVTRTPGRIVGQVAVVDHFGNLISDIELSPDEGARVRAVTCQGQRVPWGRTYSDAPTGAAIALLDSWGCVEVAVAGGSAAARFSAGVGDAIEVLTDD